VCIGLNYRRHAAETGQPVPKQPILFNKYNSALNCGGGTIAVSRKKAEKFDYEAERVIVIGRTARNVSEADAANYIFGYCNGNDFTARDLQSRSSQWMLGKTLDGAGVIGPWLVTADQVDGDNLKIECRVNGEVRQSSNTSDMVFNCKQLVSCISDYIDVADWRRHLHGYARGSDFRVCEGEAGLAQAGGPHYHRHREARRVYFTLT
jgi:2-keto-4-pentenoate hydratase/2-oxohepta-3-ene-1,7-dioic acid hydratase in catechol pathway